MEFQNLNKIKKPNINSNVILAFENGRIKRFNCEEIYCFWTQCLLHNGAWVHGAPGYPSWVRTINTIGQIHDGGYIRHSLEIILQITNSTKVQISFMLFLFKRS